MPMRISHGGGTLEAEIAAPLGLKVIVVALAVFILYQGARLNAPGLPWIRPQQPRDPVLTVCWTLMELLVLGFTAKVFLGKEIIRVDSFSIAVESLIGGRCWRHREFENREVSDFYYSEPAPHWTGGICFRYGGRKQVRIARGIAAEDGEALRRGMLKLFAFPVRPQPEKELSIWDRR